MESSALFDTVVLAIELEMLSIANTKLKEYTLDPFEVKRLFIGLEKNSGTWYFISNETKENTVNIHIY